ncbi:MAG: TRAP transporter fused permease subunit [Burkholderiales bacterium]
MSTPDPNESNGTLAPVARALAGALASLITIGSIAWALDVVIWFRLNLYPAQFFAAVLALALPLAFIVMPARRKTRRTHVPWYDWLGAAIGFAAIAYLTWEYQNLVDLILLRPPGAVIAGGIAIVLSLEALRRATGHTLVIISVVFIAYALWGDVLPGRLAARTTDWQKLTAYLALDVNGILGLPLAVASTIVIAFLLFGELLTASRGSHFFTDVAMLTMGRFRGGPAKMAVVGSALFGSVSGSAVANVVATGVITIPLIKRSGYPAHKAAAIEAVASTGGQLMPPVMGASAFLMAEFLQIPYKDVVLAALLPAILFYVALFVQADLDAARMRIPPLDERDLPPVRQTLRGLYFALPFVILIMALFVYNQTPQMAALLASAAMLPLAVIFGYRGRRPGWRDILSALPGAGFAALDIILVCVAAGIVIGVLGISGLGFGLTLTLVQIGEGNLAVLLFLTALVCIVLGMGLPTVGVYVLLAALVAPSLVKVGITPIAAHLYVMYFGMMSMITPPVAIAAFAAASLANADPMRSGWSAVAFGWTAFVVPILFVLSPQLLLIGDAWAIALTTITAIAGVWLVSIAIAGYFVRQIAIAPRFVFAAAGLLALIPAGAFPGAVYTDIVGAFVGGGLIARELFLVRAQRATAR